VCWIDYIIQDLGGQDEPRLLYYDQVKSSTTESVNDTQSYLVQSTGLLATQRTRTQRTARQTIRIR